MLGADYHKRPSFEETECAGERKRERIYYFFNFIRKFIEIPAKIRAAHRHVPGAGLPQETSLLEKNLECAGAE
jgi:hypothetical protein